MHVSFMHGRNQWPAWRAARLIGRVGFIVDLGFVWFALVVKRG